MPVTRKAIEYSVAPYGHIATIPKGTPVVKAENIPGGGYWVQAWEDMMYKAKGWLRGYGFLVHEHEITEG